MKNINNIKIIEGNLTASDAQFAIVVSRFNSFIVDHLLDGALDTLYRNGVSTDKITVVRVPGAFELPITSKRLASSKQYRAIIALGAVIRGSTAHFEYVASACVDGLKAVSLDENIPVALGVLTVDTIEQAIERAGTKAGNKGIDAAQCAIEMVNLFDMLSR